MANNIAGTVQIDLGGKQQTLRYDWDGIAEITQKFPDGYNLMDPGQLSQILAIGLKHDMPDITPDGIMKMSPPIIAAMEAVGAAINCAYFGTPKAPEASGEETENPQRKVAKRA
jgi:hypothetical protein